MIKLTPGDDLTRIDGPLLVLLCGVDPLSYAAKVWFVRRIRQLSDRSEFWAAVARTEDFPALASDSGPAVVHLFSGRIASRCDGLDDMEEFVEDFINGNRRK